MTELQDAARAAMAVRLVESTLKENADNIRGDAREVMADSGAERIRVPDDNGVDLGTVTLAAGRFTARVTDERVFLEWVRLHHPTEVVEAVRPSFRKHVLDGAAAKAAPDDLTPVGPDGEVLPGVEVRQGASWLAVRPSDEARARMRQVLSPQGLRALTAGLAAGEVSGDA